MKRKMGVLVSVVGVMLLASSSVVFAELFGKKSAKAAPAAASPTTSEPKTNGTTVSGEKVAYTFTDEATMQGFTKLQQQRQGVFVRMTVLQSYFNEEQAQLAELNSKLAKEYGLDVSKNYSLDAQRRVIIERETPPVPPASATVPAAPQSTPSGSSAP